MPKNDKIVTNGIKMDLHIHSSYSISSDGKKSKVVNNKIENFDILLNSMLTKDVKVFSITDHNVFDKDLFSAIKNKINENDITIFPGIEFTIKDDKKNIQNLHVVVIFEDINDNISNVHEKIYNINKEKSSNPVEWEKKWKNNRWKELNQKNWTIKEFIEFWNNWKIPIVTIAHQKNTYGNTIPITKKSNDIISIKNVNNFDEANNIIKVMFIDSLEYSKKKSENFVKIFQKDINNISYITGSDNHNWKNYNFDDHTFFYCLPTFKGLVMSITNPSNRIKQSKKNIKSGIIESIEYNINNEIGKMELSPDINVIIGDNGCGKTSFLKTIFKDDKKTSWHKDFNINSITANDLEKKTFKFIEQGQIRENTQKIFDEDYYPKLNLLGKEELKNEIVNKVNKIFEMFKSKKIFLELNEDKLIIPKEITNNSIVFTTYNNILKQISGMKEIIEVEKSTKNLRTVLSKGEFRCTEDENEIIDKFVQILNNKESLIKTKNQNIDTINQNLRLINKIFQVKNSEISGYKTDLEKKFSNTKEQNKKLINSIKTYEYIDKIHFTISEELVKLLNQNKSINNKDNINFIRQISFLEKNEKFDNNYVEDLLIKITNKNSFGKNNKFWDYIENKDSISSWKVNSLPDDKTKSEIMKKILDEFEQDFEVKKSVSDTRGNANISYGIKSRLIISNLNDISEKIIIIDQPEDDISNINIKDHLMKDLRILTSQHQIILVTHNPQVVVNLDVENVICIKENSEGKLKIFNGSLEYKDEKVNILLEVEKLLDGGKEAIHERLTKYE